MLQGRANSDVGMAPKTGTVKADGLDQLPGKTTSPADNPTGGKSAGKHSLTGRLWRHHLGWLASHRCQAAPASWALLPLVAIQHVGSGFSCVGGIVAVVRPSGLKGAPITDAVMGSSVLYLACMLIL